MGQEWRLYDVGGARNTVRLRVNPPLNSFNLLTLGIREEHGIPTLMMVGNKETASPIANLLLQSMPSSSLREFQLLSLFFFTVLI